MELRGRKSSERIQNSRLRHARQHTLGQRQGRIAADGLYPVSVGYAVAPESGMEGKALGRKRRRGRLERARVLRDRFKKRLGLACKVDNRELQRQQKAALPGRLLQKGVRVQKARALGAPLYDRLRNIFGRAKRYGLHHALSPRNHGIQKAHTVSDLRCDRASA